MTNNVITKEEKKVRRMMKVDSFFTNLQYLTLASLIVAQCVVGKAFLIGQSIYLFANLISVARNFVLHRPMSDKIKDVACTAITIGLILYYVL